MSPEPALAPRPAIPIPDEDELMPRFGRWGDVRVRERTEPIDLRHVVVGVDGSDGSAIAVEWARFLAASFDSTIELVTVVAPPPYGFGDLLGSHMSSFDPSPGWRGVLDAERKSGADLLERAGKELADASTVHRHLGVGNPGAYLARIARETDAGLIVVGAHGSGAFDRTLLGSVAESVKQLAPTSVLIAKTPPSEAPSLLATDGSLASRDAVAAGLWLSLHLDSDPLVFHAIGPHVYGVPEDPDALTHAARAVFDDAVRRVPGMDAERVHFEAAFGPPARAIVDHAAHIEAGLVVMGTRGLTGLRGLAIGSVSNRVSHLSPCSVLLVKAMRP